MTRESQRKVRNNKAKGRKLQQDVAKRIAFYTKSTYGKDKAVESREMGQAGVDVKLNGSRVKKMFPFAVECKSGKSTSWLKAIRQVKEALKKSSYAKYWLVVLRNTNIPGQKKTVVVMDIDLFFQLYFNGRENLDAKIYSDKEFSKPQKDTGEIE